MCHCATVLISSIVFHLKNVKCILHKLMNITPTVNEVKAKQHTGIAWQN